MGADKNSSRRRWKLQQDEHGFQHMSPTHYPTWPNPRSHWSATEPRIQLPTLPTRERSGTPNLESTDQHRSDRSLLVKLGDFHRVTPHRSEPESPKTPNRPTELQTDPNSKQQQHGTTAKTHKRSPEQKPKKGCTGQTGLEHRSDRSSLGNSG
jgi:hypothetical protein